MPKYEYKLSDSLDEVLDWLGEKDRKLVTILGGNNSYGPFFTAIVEVEPEPIGWNPDTGVPTIEFEPPKKKGGRPKGWKKGDPYV